MLKSIIGYTGDPQYDAPRTGDVKHSLADISELQQAVGYAPTVAFQEGLERTVSWYRRGLNIGAEMRKVTV